MAKSIDIDFNLFKIFRAIFKTKSISKAAIELGLSQPAVSNALTRLRKIFNDPLFVQVSRMMEPTELAERIAGEILEGAGLLENTLQEIVFDPQTAQDTFHLSMSDYTEVILLPKLLKRLKKNAPLVNVEIKHIAMLKRHKALEEGETDFNIHGSITGFHEQKYSAGILQKSLFQDEYVIVLNREEHSIEEGELTIEKLYSLPQARYGSDVVDKILFKQGLKRRILLKVPHILVLPRIVAQSDLAMTIPSRLAEILPTGFNLQIFNPPIPIPPLVFHMYWHERRQNSPAHRWFRQELVKVAETL